MKRSILTVLALCAFALLLSPTVAEAGSCNATQSCPAGSVAPSVSCTGSSSCNVGSNYVQCDSQPAKYCETEVCERSKLCPKPPYSEQWYIHCTANNTSDRCTEGYDYVQCGSNVMTCQQCEDAANGGGGFMCLAAALQAEPEETTESLRVGTTDQSVETSDAP